jgi:hypothetical protein
MEGGSGSDQVRSLAPVLGRADLWMALEATFAADDSCHVSNVIGTTASHATPALPYSTSVA